MELSEKEKYIYKLYSHEGMRVFKNEKNKLDKVNSNFINLIINNNDIEILSTLIYNACLFALKSKDHVFINYLNNKENIFDDLISDDYLKEIIMDYALTIFELRIAKKLN